MGIYPKEITDEAQSTGNSNVLLLYPKYKQDLQKLYTDCLVEEPQPALVKFEVCFKFNNNYCKTADRQRAAAVSFLASNSASLDTSLNSSSSKTIGSNW